MLRWVIIALIALGASLYFPRSRAVVLDVTAPALQPFRGLFTKSEMRKIARELRTYESTYRRIPTSHREFVDWMAARFPNEDVHRDAWGTEYTLSVTADSFVVRSFGPDMKDGGDDDLVLADRRDDPWG